MSRWLPLLLIAAFAGCQGGETPEPAQPTARLSDGDAALALDIYSEQGCAVCHGDDAGGGDLGPALSDLGPYFDEARLATYLRDPDAFVTANPDFSARRTAEYGMAMPAYDSVELFDRRLLARWLLTR